ncbi:hypothetical protein MMC27_006805 [Xylographa pallens]|nr:hypothetical protein [Xylographa pallens]
MELQSERSEKVDTVDGSTETDEELLAFLVPDSQIERELSASPNSPSLLIPHNTAPIPATLRYSATSSLECSHGSPLYMKTVTTHEQSTSDQPLEYPVLPTSTPDSPTILQDSVTFRTTPIGAGILQYPILPQSSPELSVDEVDRFYRSQDPDFGESFISTKARVPLVVDRSASNITKAAALDHKWTSKVQDNKRGNKPNSLAPQVQSVAYQNPSRVDGFKNKVLTNAELGRRATAAGILLSKPAIYGQDKPADHIFTELYAEDYDLSEIDFPKNRSLQYILTKIQSTEWEDEQTAGPAMSEEVDQAMMVSGDDLDSIDKEPPPACNICYVEAWLAEIQAENINLPEGLPTYPTGASPSHVNKARGLALIEAGGGGSGEDEKNKVRTFEEDNAFIKFRLGISTAASSGITTVSKGANQLPYTPSPMRAVSSIQRRKLPGERWTDTKTGPVNPFHQAASAFRARQLYVDNSIAQMPSHPKSHPHTSSDMCSKPVLFERAPPDLDRQGVRNLVPRRATRMQGQTALAFRGRQCMPIQGAHAESGVQPLPMSTKLLAHLPKTNTRLNTQTLQHLESAHNIWYPDPRETMADNRSALSEAHASDFDEPDWTAEEWLSIERNAIGNAHHAREA